MNALFTRFANSSHQLTVAIIIALTLSALSFLHPLSWLAPASSTDSSPALDLGRLPLSFTANQGQTDDQVKFLSRGSGYDLFLAATEAVLALRQPAALTAGSGDTPSTEYAVLRMQLVGANPEPQVAGLEELPGKVNYLIGNDPTKWRTDVPTYARVRYHDVYPGVDLVYYGNQRQLEYDFIVAPGAEPQAITVRFQGSEDIEIDTEGDLLLHSSGAEVRLTKPLIYQEVGGAKLQIAGEYVLTGPDEVKFKVGAYDPSRPLIIDPILDYSTFVGGSGYEYGYGVAVDGLGNAYLVGDTMSPDFPTTSGAFDTEYNGDYYDAFVAKLNPEGTGLVYATFLGGSDVDKAQGIAVDSSGYVYVVGHTFSADFPISPDAYDRQLDGEVDYFVARLYPSGTGLVYSTFLGGQHPFFERLASIAVDRYGNAYVTGQTSSSDFPTTDGAFDRELSGYADLFVTKLNPDGTGLVYSTFIGGTSFREDNVYHPSIAVDSLGHAYVAGWIYALAADELDFPTTDGAFDQEHSGYGDIFVTKLNPDGTDLVYSTFLGGSGEDRTWVSGGSTIAVDGDGYAYVTGVAGSPDFPTTEGAYNRTHYGTAFVTKLNPQGTDLVYSTYLGGGIGYSIAVDSSGSAHVTGAIGGNNLPLVRPVQCFYAGGNDAFAVKLNSQGTDLVYSTYIGGLGSDYGYSIALDSLGNAYVGGVTAAADFPTTPDAYDTTYAGGYGDGFVFKIDPVLVPNTRPELEEIDYVSANPVHVNTRVNMGARFSDPDEPDSHTAMWDWGDGSTSEGYVYHERCIGGRVSWFHTYTSPGVYTVKVTITDQEGASDELAYQYLVAYDPSAGFVTGAGFVDSPPGAYVANPSLTGNALFGFVSMYQHGARVPSGRTQFRFQVADLSFVSTSYEWLVVSGPKVQFKGTGAINGAGNYGFIVSAVDEALTPSTDVDLFRIKIWDKDNEDTIVYDNLMGAEDDADPTTAIGGGNIVIQKH
jgi:hypothetical protein